MVAMETVGCDSLNYCVREKLWSELSFDITRLLLLLHVVDNCHTGL